MDAYYDSFNQSLINICRNRNEIKIIIKKRRKEGGIIISYGSRNENGYSTTTWWNRVSNLTFRERQKRCDGIMPSRINKCASDFRFRQILGFLTYACSIESPGSKSAFTKYSKLHRYACHRTRDTWILITQPRFGHRYFSSDLFYSFKFHSKRYACTRIKK